MLRQPLLPKCLAPINTLKKQIQNLKLMAKKLLVLYKIINLYLSFEEERNEG